jgi:hypothetical protein
MARVKLLANMNISPSTDTITRVRELPIRPDG